MTTEKELQEKMLVYRILESRLEVLTKQKDLISNKIAEVVSTISSIDQIEKNENKILFKLGSEAYVYGNISDQNKILVEIGAGIVSEKSIKEGKLTLERRRIEMENVSKEIQNNLSQISITMNQLTPEINKLIRKSQDQNTFPS